MSESEVCFLDLSCLVELFGGGLFFCFGGSSFVVLGLVFFGRFKILYSFIELFSM